ncbi:hypothetical protein NP233_g2691 [Leucocoprinus birnbaumii]|uniref:Uncharacterized protein n=1 Tax=Leucocoprinus birnbaumii TaxID=56174 RepID=A0AAD5VYF4_9AGAR|nr:hypothetical protein NP233_g2691 [Leucocoprinus birnbaumii]
MILARHKISPGPQDATGSTPDEAVAPVEIEDPSLERTLAGYFLGEEDSQDDGASRLSPNHSSASIASAYEDDSRIEVIDSTPPVLPPLSIDSNNGNTTLVGEMKA